jgi:hypothetical protein
MEETQAEDQARKFGPGCPWSYRNWVPPRQGDPKFFWSTMKLWQYEHFASRLEANFNGFSFLNMEI